MVAYSFQREFVRPIIERRKRQTIRADRKRHASAGEALQLFHGMRTTNCFLIGKAVCAGVVPIRMDFKQSRVTLETGETYERSHQLDTFARADGFDDWYELNSFWAKHHAGITVFSGVRITWSKFTMAEGVMAKLGAAR